MKTLKETFPTGPKYGDLYKFGTKEELRCFMNGKWLPAYRFTLDQSPTDIFEWLKEHGITRGTVCGTAVSGVGSLAVLFQNKVGNTNLELAFPGDLLVAHEGIFGVRVYGFPKRTIETQAPLREYPDRIVSYDAEKSVYLLKLRVEQLQCVRAGLIEMFTRQHPTTDWKGAGELYGKITKQIQMLLGVFADEQEEEN